MAGREKETTTFFWGEILFKQQCPSSLNNSAPFVPFVKRKLVSQVHEQCQYSFLLLYHDLGCVVLGLVKLRIKGRWIWKQICQAVNSPKKQTNKFLFLSGKYLKLEIEILVASISRIEKQIHSFVFVRSYDPTIFVLRSTFL